MGTKRPCHESGEVYRCSLHDVVTHAQCGGEEFVSIGDDMICECTCFSGPCSHRRLSKITRYDLKKDVSESQE